MKPNTDILQKLEVVGLKTTQQRMAVLEEAIALERHFDAEELAMRLRNRGIRASRATVYRTLAALSAGGLIREVHSDDLHSHYELVKGNDHHDHLICQVCGVVEEFSDPQIEELQENLCEARGFEPLRHRLEIIGVCQSCRDKKKP
jgi:Fur family ferric uptake transcriptional regulator